MSPPNQLVYCGGLQEERVKLSLASLCIARKGLEREELVNGAIGGQDEG